LTLTSGAGDLGSQGQVGTLAAGSSVTIITTPSTAAVVGQFDTTAVVSGTYIDGNNVPQQSMNADPVNCLFATPGAFRVPL